MNIKSTATYSAFRKFGKNLRKTVKRYFFRKKLSKGIPVFIYQMGKVASSSIHSSLARQYPGPVAHAHHIGHDNWSSMEIYNWYNNNEKIRIITLIREPVGRNVSAFFQLFEDHTGLPFRKSNFSIEELKSFFLENVDHDRPLNWFDKNILQHFNIDVYSQPFPENGHIALSNNNIELLILRFDLDDATKEKLIRDFIDLPEFKIERSNVGAEKDYHSTYKQFQKEAKLPNEYLDKICSSKYFTHFFPEDEIDKVRKKWAAKE